MKLSKKGRDRLYGSHNVFYDDDIEGDVVALYELSEVWEFEPDDFQGCVCLTLDEAKRVQSALYELLRNSNDKNSREWLTYWMLIGRIEKAEKEK